MRLLPPASTEPDGPAIPAFAPRAPLCVLLALVLLAATTSIASADSVAPGPAAFHRGDYARAARKLSPSAERGNARAFGRLGFRYEHGFGVPQNYDAAADLYCRGAEQGDPFAQAMLGLMYDKGHGVPEDFVLAYKWLNLAAARAGGRQREAYLRFRDAVASKLSRNEIVAGQKLALRWVAVRSVPEPRPTGR
ncbi:tetratricopeptide repeat protein [Bradyrhizobium liaoningense]|uniref:tetratricopeptide repeat protein n=1 Tax=Bradyrhizobium liaoningense TaxID=43992 RepID=UPI001BAC2D55|nr:tetratricopeptide repeat protein [Bradyrhizobium liaoningense]MBR0822670.1 sel1 repeat family protein [Bradyrhizobium liaoningense]